MRSASLTILVLVALATPGAGPAQAPAPEAAGAPEGAPVAAAAPSFEELDRANPVQPLPAALAGHGGTALADHPSKPDPEKVRLGRWLFFDERLSEDGTIACASCHVPRHAFSEPRATSAGIGGQVGGRKAPSFVNAVFAFYPATFWDGRAASLEEQAKGPMVNPIEMGRKDHDSVVASVQTVAGYKEFFARAFGSDEITIDRIAEAIAHYERTRISGNSPWDRYKEGAGEDAATLVSDPVKTGEELFFGKAKCATCHVGNWFTDSKFHNLGIGWNPESKSFADAGRFAVTGADEDRGAFKTPGLRDVALHAPYMHDGSLATLEEVVEHYRRGGTPNPWLSKKMERLDLTDEEAGALVAFMESLTGEGYLDTEPALFPR